MNQDSLEFTLEGKAAAVLDVRRLAERCLQLETQAQLNARRLEEQADTLEQLNCEHRRLQPLADYARTELQKQKSEVITRVRALEHSAGNQNHLRSLEEKLSDEALPPQELQRIRRAVEEEFLACFPTRPRSNPIETSLPNPAQPDWSSFRLRHSC